MSDKNKSIWIKADKGNWENRKNKIINGLESGADCVLVNSEDVDKVRKLGNINVAAFGDSTSNADIVVVGKGGEGDGTKPLPSDFSGSWDITTINQLKENGKKVAGYVVIKNKDYENFAVELGEICDYVITIGIDWQVIPLENLIAKLQDKEVQIISGVKTSEEANIALETLEHGSDGVLLDSDDPNTIKETVGIAEKSQISKTELTPAVITRIEPVGMGDRVCVDTCNLMQRGEGMLVGSQSKGLFLVHSESEESPYVASRPFRVNAGAVHAYVQVGEKTRYLSELESGDEVTIVDADGKQKTGIVGRVKIERRPLMLVEAEADGAVIRTILQNAETIKLVNSDKNPVSVSDLKKGDEILVHLEKGARHFGTKVNETIIEK
ncbi:3-dehydroquinate synthase [Methanohalobium evestigatum Z-7303]|uniref:3-dehydroquinate synthase n=1 Tax=Methanohalobium evestigatum (strain ATCC BAA-1072 / DSM 3721 / NBRC 107634 / OCM 161 / Z-7303) TaxID=644295 RepID=D7EB15_METEZ|nr:3-dehydroquinate synthase II [Methanohalobium evestigatum]ADI74532.1 3-dehydroquinate synthase [Methanohalobium evestigatum Z-7303]